MIAESDVVLAYRLLMGREPDDPKTVQNMARHFKNLAELRAEFVNSEEFREIMATSPRDSSVQGCKPLTWPPADVEVRVTPVVLQQMVQRIEGEFLEMGETEPHWSVLTSDRFLATNIGEHEAEFFSSGAEVVEDLRFAAGRCGLDLKKFTTCLELGCGLGRITLWLARQFKNVIGVDISKTHLALAEAEAIKSGSKNIQFLNLNRIDQYADLPEFDFFASLIVLQHNPPPVMAFLLETILKRLSCPGAAYFQIPTYLTSYSFSAMTYLDTPPMVGNAEVHCIPQPVLFEILRRTGCEILEMREDASLGDNAISNRLLIQKSVPLV